MSVSSWISSLLTLPFAVANEPLARHTTMRLGGPAVMWIEPQTEAELVSFLELNQKVGAPLYVLGGGSNVIPTDEGWSGAVLHLGKGFEQSRVEERVLIAGGGAFLPKLTHFALENQLGNFEWACGIPGSVGGSVWGNAGARGFNGQGFEGRDAATDFAGCIAFDRRGVRHELHKDDVDFSYRRSSLGELIVTEARFTLKPLSANGTLKHKEGVRQLLEVRRKTQPANAASAGCIWKNPKVEGCVSAGALVEQCGLKGQNCGPARVSEVHANFIVNTGGANGAQVRELAQYVEEEVEDQTGIKLEREARFW
ncbi:UDP-N-acetylenolpyruvoylglucosamine reductase [Abditibacteriota bacterium]|nr:UDP-N-acetylenolpyruvoylglucosamine reductase [Abditibacteriota bacterium]